MTIFYRRVKKTVLLSNSLFVMKDIAYFFNGSK